MKLSEPQFFSFVARFVDAIATEPLSQELRQTRQQRAMRLAAFEFAPREVVAPAPAVATVALPQVAQAA